MNERSEHFVNVNRLLSPLLLVTGAIILLGTVMVFSSSYMYAKDVYASSAYFLIRQVLFVSIGALVAFVVGRTKFSFWLKYGSIIHFLALVLLGLTLVPGFGVSVKGASRWVSFGVFTFQPGELIKITLLFLAIPFFEKYNELSPRIKALQLVLLLMPFGILISQPDFGTFTICLILLGMACFLSSFPRKLFYFMSGLSSVLGVIILFMQPYRVNRIMAFLDPWKNAKTSGFQIIQSYLALASGKIIGKGLGNSSEKLFYLPEAHNDFILSVIGEELGFLGIITVVSLYIIFLYLGLRLAFSIRNRAGKILVASIVFTIILQVLLNMGVVMGLLPTKGLNLPFISYGGSSIVVNLFAIGIIISAYRSSFVEK